jgi:hypothetical protein
VRTCPRTTMRLRCALVSTREKTLSRRVAWFFNIYICVCVCVCLLVVGREG